jgi:hypothetical protein
VNLFFNNGSWGHELTNTPFELTDVKVLDFKRQDKRCFCGFLRVDFESWKG